jgi:hypothetical protein
MILREGEVPAIRGNVAHWNGIGECVRSRSAEISSVILD